MAVDVNTAILATHVYSALRERFFIAAAPGDQAEADGGEVIATIRSTVLKYLDESMQTTHTEAP